MLHWFYTLLHHPATKCHRIPLITTVQGTGKDSILKLIGKLLGGNKLFRCEDSNQIFGSFNSLLENSYMVALSEFDHTDLQRMGRLKHLVSEDCITINQKGVPARVVPSYHRFIILITNAGSQSGCSPVSIEQNERRFVALNGSSRNASNHHLFSYFHNNMSANSIRSVYEFICRHSHSHIFTSDEIPISRFQKRATYVPLVVRFMYAFIQPDIESDT
eukprot:3496016-Pleurochrysis_carterae.AAC.1